MKDYLNISELIVEKAQSTPDKKAIIFPKRKKDSYIYEYITFGDLNDLSNKYAKSFLEIGIKRGTKTLVFLKPGPDFSAATFALFKIGAIPVFIDPGMGKENLLKSITKVAPQALIGIPKVHFIRMFYPTAFKSIDIFVTSGNWAFGGEHSLHKLRNRTHKVETWEIFAKTTPEETAAILFTSGGTGTPKGVVYTHNIFWNQTFLLQKMFNLNENDIDVPGFPLFSFFTLSLGMTSCIPDMDPSKPSKANPASLFKIVRDNKATFLAGSPAIWENLANYMITHDKKLPSVKALAMFGAPVSPKLLEKLEDNLPNGNTYTPYGATEALPLCLIDGKTVLKQTQFKTHKGKGTCVGLVVPEVEIKVIQITDDVIKSYDELSIKKPFEIGEIIVSGPIVTSQYYKMPKATELSKIFEGEKIWHRMGDLGYFDEEGRLWFCGRKAHRIEIGDRIDCSVNCEAIFNQHRMIKRAALVKDREGSAIVVERIDGKIPKGKEREQLRADLLKLASSNELTSHIKKIYFSKNFPVDVRHNIKIDRHKLSQQIQLKEHL